MTESGMGRLFFNATSLPNLSINATIAVFNADKHLACNRTFGWQKMSFDLELNNFGDEATCLLLQRL
jgi:hypothetical protein